MIWYLNLKSLKNRKFTSLLTLITISLCVFFFVAIEKTREGVKTGFTNGLGNTDLIVGAKGGPLQLLLYSVFHIGNATPNIRYESYQKIAKLTQVKWAIPISLGDSYRNFKVIGTNSSFFEHYRSFGNQNLEFSQGQSSDKLFAVVLGSEVARKLGHSLNDSLILTHGLSEDGLYKHENTPFYVSGILKPTHTPIDRSVIVSLEAITAMHIGWESGVPQENLNPVTEKNETELPPSQVTAILVSAKSRIYTLQLSNEITNWEEEPLMGIIPGIVLSQLWQVMGSIEKVLLFMSICVLLVGLVGITSSLYSSLNERRREMAILRSLGFGHVKICGLLIQESFFLIVAGTILGAGGCYLFLFLASNNISQMLGISLAELSPTGVELGFYLCMIVLGVMMGILPAYRAYKMSLSDGLAIKI